MSTPAPAVSKRVLETLLQEYLPDAAGRRLVLVHGSYEPGAPTRFSVSVDEQRCAVQVSDQAGVLGIAAAWLDHQGSTGEGDVLVVTTQVDDEELDWDLRGHAVRQRKLSVDPAEVVRARFGANRLDPRIWEARWLVSALLAAEPTQGWAQAGRVLTYDAALRALTGQRLGLDAAGLDVDQLLAWTRGGGGPLRFAELPNAERAGITRWLTETIGQAVEPLLALVAAGRGANTMALGVLGSALDDPSITPDTAVAVGGLFPGIRADAVREFATAVAGTLARWLASARHGTAGGGLHAADDVLRVLDRADELAGQAGLQQALRGSPLLPSALRARQRDLAAALPDPAAAERALVELERHLLAEVYAQQRQAARMAVRIARWLGTPEPEVRSVAAGLRQQVTEWGWADWAREVVWAGDDSADPQVADAYRRLCERAIQRRDRLDQRFAERLAPWAERAATQAPQDCLLIEDVLDRVAVPLARSKVPLVVVLPGMNAAVAAELGQELAQWQHWVEAGPEPGARLAAAAAVPSTGGTGLAALLSGTLGNEDTAQAGFAAFWKRHRKQAKLFTSAEIGGGAGHRLDGEVLTALAEDKVVGLVLDTIDDTLGRGRPGSGAGWRIGDIRFLGELLAQASSYGRPVLLATDHGHVLDRGTPGVEIDGEHGARWRTGAAGEGELELTGPRVGDGGGRVTVPWRTGIHYGRARAGYHGGANPAELAAPVLVLLPSRELLPSGWSALSPESVPPAWWRGTSSGRPEAAPEPRKPARDRGKATAQQGAALFEVHEPAAPAPSSLGERVVASKVYEAQKVFVRKAPAAKVVAAVLDRIVEAGGTLSVTAVVAAAGTAARNPDGFLATLQRLLNVEGYPVIEPIDAGRNVKVQVELLREQFEVDGT